MQPYVLNLQVCVCHAVTDWRGGVDVGIMQRPLQSLRCKSLWRGRYMSGVLGRSTCCTSTGAKSEQLELPLRVLEIGEVLSGLVRSLIRAT